LWSGMEWTDGHALEAGFQFAVDLFRFSLRFFSTQASRDIEIKAIFPEYLLNINLSGQIDLIING